MDPSVTCRNSLRAESLDYITGVLEILLDLVRMFAHFCLIWKTETCFELLS